MLSFNAFKNNGYCSGGLIDRTAVRSEKVWDYDKVKAMHDSMCFCGKRENQVPDCYVVESNGDIKFTYDDGEDSTEVFVKGTEVRRAELTQDHLNQLAKEQELERVLKEWDSMIAGKPGTLQPLSFKMKSIDEFICPDTKKILEANQFDGIFKHIKDYINQPIMGFNKNGTMAEQPKTYLEKVRNEIANREKELISMDSNIQYAELQLQAYKDSRAIIAAQKAGLEAELDNLRTDALKEEIKAKEAELSALKTEHKELTGKK